MLGLILMTALLGGSIDVMTTGVVDHGTLSSPAQHQLTYDAADSTKNRRKDIGPNSRSEDQILDSAKRARMQANAADISRNFAIVSWMVRRHLDYVASFQFHARTDDKAFNDLLEAKVRQWALPYNFDAAGRHSMQRYLRLLEAQAVLKGDVGTLKLASGYVQGIESDRIRNTSGQTSEAGGQWIHGVKVNDAGRAIAFNLCKRQPYGGWQFERTVSASNLILHGYFDRFDQVRGISPLAPALNTSRDVYENFGYALAKAKVEQLFAMMITRQALDAAGDVENTGEEGTERSKYNVDFGGGPILLDMDPGDTAQFLNSQNPSANFQAFTNAMLMVCLKALDIPYSFYDEGHTNFFGSRGAWMHYERSCGPKRDSLMEHLRRLTVWRLGLMLLDGELQLPRGMTSLADVAWEWVPTGMPWWDPAKEIRGNLMAIAAALDTPQRICKESGTGDWFDNVDEIAKALQYAQDKLAPLNASISFNPGPAPIEINANVPTSN